MRGTKEFHEMQLQFEKDITSAMYGHKIERIGKTEKAPISVFYNDGTVNQWFQVYMLGYQSGKYVVGT